VKSGSKMAANSSGSRALRLPPPCGDQQPATLADDSRCASQFTGAQAWTVVPEPSLLSMRSSPPTLKADF
jgi:hypothetical protein